MRTSCAQLERMSMFENYSVLNAWECTMSCSNSTISPGYLQEKEAGIFEKLYAMFEVFADL